MGINKLLVESNNLNELPDAVWGNEYIYILEIDNNNITAIAPSIKKISRSLTHIYMSNNSLDELPIELFTLNLATIYVDGNNLKIIPSQLGKVRTLKHLRFNNNDNISNIPSEIGNLFRLIDIDLRNNAIDSLPMSFESLTRLAHIYLHDNPICTNGWIENGASKTIQKLISEDRNAGCRAQCSIYCPDMFTKDGMCDDECNSIPCKYDGGDCSYI